MSCRQRRHPSLPSRVDVVLSFVVPYRRPCVAGAFVLSPFPFVDVRRHERRNVSRTWSFFSISEFLALEVSSTRSFLHLEFLQLGVSCTWSLFSISEFLALGVSPTWSFFSSWPCCYCLVERMGGREKVNPPPWNTVSC